MHVNITSLALGNMGNFIYFISDEATNQTFIVDPAWDFAAIAKHIETNQLEVIGVLLTHTHDDHTSAVHEVLSTYDVPVYLTETEYQVGRIQLTAPHFIRDGDTIALGEKTVTVIETPGHTAGGVCYWIADTLITGDTLFVDGCGRCDFADADVEIMWDSLQKLKRLPDETRIYGGHDYGQQPSDTLGTQKQTNPYLLIDDKAFFVAFRSHLQSQYRSIPFAPSSLAEMQAIKAIYARNSE